MKYTVTVTAVTAVEISDAYLANALGVAKAYMEALHNLTDNTEIQVVINPVIKES